MVVHREVKLAVATNINSSDSISSRCSSAIPPNRPQINLLQYDFNEQPLLSLPQTDFQRIHENGTALLDSRISSNFSPMPTRDHQQDIQEEVAAITTQVSFVVRKKKFGQ